METEQDDRAPAEPRAPQPDPPTGPVDEPEVYSGDDEDKVAQRLRDLGYLD